MFLPRVNPDEVESDLPQGVHVRRLRAVRIIGLLAVAGIFVYGLWRSDLFGQWGERGGATKTPPTTFYLSDGSTIVDKTQVGDQTWYLVVTPTSDKRLCYQLADSGAHVIFSCVGTGIAPMAPDTKDAVALVMPPLATEAAMPPVVMGSASADVARVELRAGNATQSLRPVPWPELGRSGFIAPISPELANALLGNGFLAVAYDANGRCVAAVRTIPVGEVKLTKASACPK